MEKTFANENLKVIWIGFQDKELKIKEYVSKHNIQDSVGYDNGEKISKQYGIRYGAGLVIINREGVVKRRLSKGFSEKKIREAIDAVLIDRDKQNKQKNTSKPR